jgi:uncharacterized damage-inducible protein DinB
MRRHLALFLALAAVPVLAQAQEPGHEMGGHDEGVVSIRPLYDQFKGWLIASAEQMPEEKYAFQPTQDVRTFGQLIGHVANASYFFCSSAIGEESPASTNLEEATSKADLVKGIKDAFTYCDKAYQMEDAKAMEQIKFFGQDGSRLWVLNFNVAHNAEHYGNLVTYMRMNEMVPPSSQGGM